MTPQEMASKEVEVVGWLKSKGYDRRTWNGMSKIIVDYLAEHADVVKAKQTCANCGSNDVIMFTADDDICNNCGRIV